MIELSITTDPHTFMFDLYLDDSTKGTRKLSRTARMITCKRFTCTDDLIGSRILVSPKELRNFKRVIDEALSKKGAK
jgi:hypothetical protein